MIEITHGAPRHFSRHTHTASLMTTLAKGKGVRGGGGGIEISGLSAVIRQHSVLGCTRGYLHLWGGGRGEDRIYATNQRQNGLSLKTDIDYNH
jgi:hypothetical protein